MKLFLGFILIVPLFSLGQINWEWAKASTGNDLEEGWCVTTDRSNNVYISGTYAGTIIFGTDTLPDTNNYTLFLVKYGFTGNVLWAKNGEGDGLGMGVSLATDASNNVYLTGYYQGDSIKLDNITLYNNNINSATNVFIAKYDSAGNLLWAKQPVGNNWCQPYGIAVDGAGNSYITGYFTGIETFDTVTLTSTNHTGNTFVAKYNTEGNLQWVRAATGSTTGANAGYSVATDIFSNAYITGFFGSADHYITFGNITLTRAGSSGIFIAKYDSAGNAIWAVSPGAGAGAGGHGACIATEPSGNIYVTGLFNGDSIVFDSTTLPSHGANAFVAKYNSSGNVVWAKITTAPQHAGYYCQGYNIATGDNGNIYVSGGGFLTDSLFVVDTTLYFTNPVDPAFLFVFDQCGNLIGAEGFESGGDDQNGVSADHAGNAYLVGDFDTPVFILGNDTLSANIGEGGETIFIGKFKSDNPSCIQTCNLSPPTILPTTTTICPTDSAQICAPANFTSYTWNNSATGNCIEAKSAGNYYVTVTDISGCTAESNHVSITAFQSPPVSISRYGDTLSVYNAPHVQWYVNNNPISGATSNIYIVNTSGSYTVQVTDTNGCPQYSQPIVFSGINNINDDENISIYPNPLSNGSWQLAVSNNLIGAQVDVSDDRGRIVYRSEIKNTHSEIDAPFAGGVYLLRITTNGGVVVRKLVKL